MAQDLPEHVTLQKKHGVGQEGAEICSSLWKGEEREARFLRREVLVSKIEG